jgi:hypothetical protein
MTIEHTITAETTRVYFTTCTPELRWIERTIKFYSQEDGTLASASTLRVLQQKWAHETMPPSEATFEWRDVPTVREV